MLSMPQAATTATDGELEFLRTAARAIAGLVPEDRSQGCLTLPLLMSASIASSGVDLYQACDRLLALRDSILQASSVDPASEPIPLVVGDRRQAVLSLAVYVDGLVSRAARAVAAARADIVERALATFGI
jgi:hypothetical protein